MGDMKQEEGEVNSINNDDLMNQITKAFENETKELITNLMDEVSATKETPNLEDKLRDQLKTSNIREGHLKEDKMHEMTMEELENKVMQNNYVYDEDMIDDINGSIAEQISNQAQKNDGNGF